MVISSGTLLLAGAFLVLNMNLQFVATLATLPSPEAPIVRQLPNQADRSVAVEWNDVPGADHYAIQQWRPTGWVDLPDTSLGIEIDSIGSRAIVRKLTPGALINTYRVSALGCGRTSEWSLHSRHDRGEMQHETVRSHWQDHQIPIASAIYAPYAPSIAREPVTASAPQSDTTSIWSARLTVSRIGSGPKDFGYSSNDRLGLISPDATMRQIGQGEHVHLDRESPRRVDIEVVNAQQTATAFMLELQQSEHLPAEFLLTIEDVTTRTIATLSSCDSLRVRTSEGVRYIWPGVDLSWRAGTHARLTISELSGVSLKQDRYVLQPVRLLTATFDRVPTRHSGDAFTLQVHFSQPMPDGVDLLQHGALYVTGGTVDAIAPVGAQRTSWAITISPDDRASVHLRLLSPPHCALPSAICASGQVPLANQPEATVLGPPIYADFMQWPAHHSGSAGFSVVVQLSEPLRSVRTLHDAAMATTGGTVTDAQAVDGRRDLFELAIEPDAARGVDVAIDPAIACQPSLAPCLDNVHRIADRLHLHVPPATVHLTFDDGPHPVYTPQILDILANHNARATFFVTGWSAQRYPELIERIVGEGHTLANHTWGHEALDTLSQQEFDDTVLRTQRALGEHATACIRPPFYRANRETYERASRLGLTVIIGNVRPQDWTLPGATVIAERIVRGAAPNAVVVLHDGGGDRSQTVEGLRMALDLLQDHHYAFEPLCS